MSSKGPGWSHLQREDSSEIPLNAGQAPVAQVPVAQAPVPPAPAVHAPVAPAPAAYPPVAPQHPAAAPQPVAHAPQAPVAAHVPHPGNHGGSPGVVSPPPTPGGYPPGVAMQQHPGHQAPQQPVRAHAHPPAGSIAKPGDAEIIFEGVARATSVYSGYLKWFGASIVGGIVAYLLGLITFFSTWPLWILGFVGIPGMLWTFFRFRTTRYKITNRRIEHEHGVLTTTVDSIELWRVLDVRYSQNIIDRMFGNATVTLIGTDQTDPEFELYGMPNARKLFEDLREAVQAARHTSRPMEMVGADGMMENMLEHQ